MSTVNAPHGDMVVEMLLLMHLVALGVALMLFGWMYYIQYRARRRAAEPVVRAHTRAAVIPAALTCPTLRPLCWVAVRSTHPEVVRQALGLNHAAPCSWSDGLTGEHPFFISPRLNGWVIVTGLALPTPSEDVDACFIFLASLSRKLGHVQFFQTEPGSRHHAWARLDDGYVTRAFAWAGSTVWCQGVETLPEIEAGLKSYGYGVTPATVAELQINVDKIPALAARWSLDPAGVKLNSVHQANGIAGCA